VLLVLDSDGNEALSNGSSGERIKHGQTLWAYIAAPVHRMPFDSLIARPSLPAVAKEVICLIAVVGR
jgi:hypothetical protein